MGRRRSRSRRAAPSALPATPWWSRFGWQAAAIAGMALAAFWNTLGVSVHYDDWALLNDPFIRARDVGLALFRLSQTRPLTFWTFHLNFLAGAAEPFGFHLVNVLLHAANAVLVLWIARRHLGAAAAFLAAALFAIHPIQTEAVAYIFQRASLLAAFFALLCFALFLKKRYWWSAVAFAVSLLAKEETISLPAFLLLYDYLFVAGRNWREMLRRKWYYAALLLFAGMAAARLFYVLAIIPNPGVGFQVTSITAVSYALTQARVVWHYLRLLVLPVGQNLDYDFLPSRSLFSPWTTLPAMILLLAGMGALVVLLRRGASWPFWVLGYFLLLAPSSSIVPQDDVIYEHRTYLPMAAMALALGWLLAWLLPRIRMSEARYAIALALLGACLALTVARNRVWASELSLWSDVVAKSSGKARPYVGLGRAFLMANRPADARTAFECGLALDPGNSDLNANLGVLLLQSGDAAGAYECFRKVLEASPPTPENLTNTGAALFASGQQDGAIQMFRRALALDPCFYNARRNLMTALAKRGDKQQALEAGTLPAGCRLLREQEEDLARYRDEVARQ